MGTQDTYREANRRSHRLLGYYLALQAWTGGVDCVVLKKDALFPYLGLKKRMEQKRIEWLTHDVKPIFKHHWWTEHERTATYSTLYLSRYKFPADAKVPTLTDEDRIKLFDQAGLKCSLIALPSETEIVGILAGAMFGLESFGLP